jgi:hypothetical protein
VWIKNSTCEQIGREVLTNWFLNENVPKSEKNRIICEDKEIGVAHIFVTPIDSSK